MIDAKQAVQQAKNKAQEMLGQASVNLEEIERDSYKGRDAWDITLSFPRDLEQVSVFLRVGADPLEYKRFLIDAETGELIAIKSRKLAA